MPELRGPPEKRSVDSLLEFGVLNLDKPPGPSAHQVSAWVKQLTEIERAAHIGTLDPKVTGCLPTLLGTATRAVAALQRVSKQYIAVLELHASPPEDLEAILSEFVTRLYQKPPRHSAVARTLRVRELFELEILDRRDRQLLLRLDCESGTYIRKLCHDIGLALGTGAHMGDLRRSQTGQFDDHSLVTLHDLTDALAFLEEDGDETPLRELLQPAEAALSHLPSVTIAPSAAEQVAHGADVYAPGVIEIDAQPLDRAHSDLVVCTTPNDAAVCLGTLRDERDPDSGVVVDLERVLV